MRAAILQDISRIDPIDDLERRHLEETVAWITSGIEIFRRLKPDNPPRHLVSYFPVLDEDHVLLVDHRNAGLWLPTGGHVEPDEHPRETVRREIREELGIDLAPGLIGPPLMVTVTETVGTTAGHTDVSLWYPVCWPRSATLSCDAQEFGEARWFPLDDVPWALTDPHLRRFIAKWCAVKRR
jgi:8-oxo-dGTP pyrophosphatase MutT (NUDIX family)